MKISGKQTGFTLLELIIVVVIMAILVSLAAPAFTQTMRKNRVETASTSLLVAFNIARNEAIRRGVHVGVCAGDPTGIVCNGGVNWQTGWIMWYGSASAVGAPTLGPPSNIIRVGAASTSVTMVAPSNQVDFDSRGFSATTGNFVTDASPCTSAVDKRVTVSLNAVGRTVTAAGLCP